MSVKVVDEDTGETLQLDWSGDRISIRRTDPDGGVMMTLEPGMARQMACVLIGMTDPELIGER